MSLLLNRLVDAGNMVIFVEHNSDVFREANWVIDLGPEGCDAEERIVAEVMPEEIVNVQASHTGVYLK